MYDVRQEADPMDRYRVTVQKGEFIVEWPRNTGANKSLILNNARDPIIELSGWSGSIQVAGMEKPGIFGYQPILWRAMRILSLLPTGGTSTLWNR